jgi:hypothetical protein
VGITISVKNKVKVGGHYSKCEEQSESEAADKFPEHSSYAVGVQKK